MKFTIPNLRLSFRNQQNLTRIAKIALIVLLILTVVWACWVVWADRHIVYTREGAQLDFSLTEESYGEGILALPPEDRVTASVYYDVGDEDKDMMDSLCASEYDLVLVNIVADVIIGLSPVLPSFLTQRSTLICSGILDVRLPDVLAALEAAGLTVTATYEKEDWRCVTAKKM